VNSEIIIYRAEDGLTRIETKLENETIWLTQAQLVELYKSSKANISEHIKHIFEEGELNRDSVVRKIRTTASDGKSYMTDHYNLDWDRLNELAYSEGELKLVISDRRYMDFTASYEVFERRYRPCKD